MRKITGGVVQSESESLERWCLRQKMNVSAPEERENVSFWTSRDKMMTITLVRVDLLHPVSSLGNTFTDTPPNYYSTSYLRVPLSSQWTHKINGHRVLVWPSHFSETQTWGLWDDFSTITQQHSQTLNVSPFLHKKNGFPKQELCSRFSVK
jgi:hypothetical protein